MPMRCGNGDGERVTVFVAVLVGTPRSALAGSDVRASAPVAAVAATSTAVRVLCLLMKAVMAMLRPLDAFSNTAMTRGSPGGLARGERHLWAVSFGAAL